MRARARPWVPGEEAAGAPGPGPPARPPPGPRPGPGGGGVSERGPSPLRPRLRCGARVPAWPCLSVRLSAPRPRPTPALELPGCPPTLRSRPLFSGSVPSAGHESSRAVAVPDPGPAPRHRGRLQPAIGSRDSETPKRGTLIWDQHPEILPWNLKIWTLNLNIWGWNPDICPWDPKIWKLNPMVLEHGSQDLELGPQDLSSKPPNLELNSELSG